GIALEAVALVLGEPVGEQRLADLVARFPCGEILLARGAAVAALVVHRAPQPVLPVDPRPLERERERDAARLAVAGRQEGADLPAPAPVLEHPGGADFLLASRLFGGGEFSLPRLEPIVERI